MKTALQFLLLFLQLTFIASAQSRYQPGYIVTAKNDTLKGLIEYKGWEYNPKSVNFKNENHAKPVQYDLNNANAFTINNAEAFEKAIVHVSKATVNVSNLPIGVDTSYTLDTVFLKVLIKGKNVSLFSFTDDNKTRFYLNDNENKDIRELNYFLYLNQNSNWIIEYGYIYRDQLALLAERYNRDKDLLKLIMQSHYKDDILKKIVTNLNGVRYQAEIQKHLVKFRPVVGLALNLNTLTFKGNPGPFPYGAETKNTAPFIFSGLDIIPNKKTQKLIFRMQFGFTFNDYNIPPTTINVLNQIATVDIKQNSFIISPQVIYNFIRANNIKVFINAGINLNLSSYNNFTYVINYENISSTSEKGYPEVEKTWFSFPFKAGVTLTNHLELSFGILLKTPITALNDYTGDVTYYQFGGAFLF